MKDSLKDSLTESAVAATVSCNLRRVLAGQWVLYHSISII